MAVVLGVTDLTGYSAANLNGNGGTYARMRSFTAAANATVTSVDFYFNSTYDGDARVKLFIANSSGTILGISSAVIALGSGGDQWISGSVGSISITSGQSYYLGWYCDNTYGPATGRLGVFTNGTGVGYYDSTSGTYAAPPGSSFASIVNDGGYATMAIRASGSTGAPATLSSPTPSGVIGTQNTATVGATTNQSNGTLYVVASATQSHITGITAAQVIAGQNSSGAAASFAANGTVSTATPTVGLTGLSSGTLYYYAVAQVTSGGNSNVVNSSFTTASTTRSTSITLYSAAGSVLASTNVRVWTRTGLSAAAADGSTTGLALTTSAGGVLNPTGLSIAAGSGWLTVKDDTDDNNCHNYPVTFS